MKCSAVKSVLRCQFPRSDFIHKQVVSIALAADGPGSAVDGYLKHFASTPAPSRCSSNITKYSDPNYSNTLVFKYRKIHKRKKVRKVIQLILINNFNRSIVNLICHAY